MRQCLLVTFSLVPEIPTLFSACLSPSRLTKSSHFPIFGLCFHTFFREGLGTVYLSLVGNCFIGYVFLTKYKILSFSSLNCKILEDRETTTFFKKVTFIYLCLAGLGLCCCLSRVAASRAALVVAGRLLIAAASPGGERGLEGLWAQALWLPVLQHRLSSRDPWAYLLCSMWELPRPGAVMSPALAGEFFSTEPPGSPSITSFILHLVSLTPAHSEIWIVT